MGNPDGGGTPADDEKPENPLEEGAETALPDDDSDDGKDIVGMAPDADAEGSVPIGADGEDSNPARERAAALGAGDATRGGAANAAVEAAEEDIVRAEGEEKEEEGRKGAMGGALPEPLGAPLNEKAELPNTEPFCMPLPSSGGENGAETPPVGGAAALPLRGWNTDARDGCTSPEEEEEKDSAFAGGTAKLG